MMKIVRRLGTYIAILALLVVPAYPAAAADGDETITLSPTAKRYEVDPGQTITDKVKVTNTGGKAFSFITYTRPYFVTGDDYTPVFSSVNNQTDAYRWVKFDMTTYSASPSQVVEVPFTLTVPENAASGGHYGVLFAETEPEAGPEGQNSVVRKKRVGAILYVTVKGDNVVKGSASPTTIGLLQTTRPLTTQTKLKNEGNVDFVDKAKIEVTDVFGQVKYSYEREATILPGTSRNVNFEWNDASTFGLYNVTVTHDFLDKHESQKAFVVMFPVWAIIVLLGVLALLIGSIVSKRQSKTKKSQKRKK